MSTLLIWLGQGADADGTYPYVLSRDGLQVQEQGHAQPSLLPDPGRGGDIVAMVPATQLSWHRVRLPKGISAQSPRLRQVLDGLLEERLLSDVTQMHLAIAPSSDVSGEVWVAACDRAWLQHHLQALEQAQRPALRIVPEMAPQADGLTMRVTGHDAQEPWLLAAGSEVAGVLCMPLSASALQLAGITGTEPKEDAAPPDWAAEPAVVQAAESLAGHPVRVLSRAERLLEAAQSPWDLAQMALARTGWARTSKRASQLWRELLHGATWRPARWGLVALLLANLVGLNALAWQERRVLSQRQEAMRTMLTTTFPQVRVVVDAPVQMQREIDQLRRATGAPSRGDFDVMLTAVATHLPGQTPTEVHYTAPAELMLRGVSLSAEQLDQLNTQLAAQRMSAQMREADLVITGEPS